MAERSNGMTDPIASEVITGGFPANQRTTVAPASPQTARRQVRPVARANSFERSISAGENIEPRQRRKAEANGGRHQDP